MNRVHSPLHICAASVGVLCVLVELLSNTQHIHHMVQSYADPAVLAAVATSIGVTIALTCAMAAFRQWHVVNGSMLLVTFLLGAAYTLSTTLDRTSSARDAALAKVWASDQTHEELRQLLRRVTYAAARSCAGSGAKSKACLDATPEIDVAKRRIEERRGELDAMGRRLAAIVPGITPAQASLYQPMLLPVTLFLMGSFLLAFGINGKTVQPEFKVELCGRDALLDKARRFTAEFKAKNGRSPKIAEVSKALGVTEFVSRGLLRDIAA